MVEGIDVGVMHPRLVVSGSWTGERRQAEPALEYMIGRVRGLGNHRVRPTANGVNHSRKISTAEFPRCKSADPAGSIVDIE